MRFSVILSFLIAIVLAGLAVYGAREWLATQTALIQQQAPAQVEDEKPRDTIVVAAEAISFGERLIPNKLQEIEWSGSIRPEGSFQKITDLVVDDTEDNARFALTSMTVGEPVLTSKITAPGVRAKLSTALTPGLKAVSIRVNDVLGVAGFVLPGDRVDVLLTRDSFVDVLLQGVKVLAIDQIADDRKDQPSVVRTVTFEVNTLEAQKLTLGAQVGVLSLALRNLTSTDVEENYRVTLEDLTDLDIAENLVGEKQDVFEETVESVALELQSEVPPSDERLEELETLLRSMSEQLNDRLVDMETKLKEPEPVIVREVVKEEVIVEAPKPIVPETVKVGVIRNGQRSEYRVDVQQLEETLTELETDEGVQQVVIE